MVRRAGQRLAVEEIIGSILRHPVDDGRVAGANLDLRLRIGIVADQHEAAALPERRIRHVGQRHIFLKLDLGRSEEHTSELQSLMRISYAVFCLKKKKNKRKQKKTTKTKHNGTSDKPTIHNYI